MAENKTSQTLSATVQAIISVLLLQLLMRALTEAFTIRLHAINDYGRIIHEFDPYFNFRATEYLYEHGWKAFRTWFDYMVWYPLGRPVGTTIYPGMQVTAVWIKNHLGFLHGDMSLNDICCFIPAWFGVTATIGVLGLTYESTRPNAVKPAQCGLVTIPILGQFYKVIIVPILDFVTKLLSGVLQGTFGLARTDPIVPLGGVFSAVFAACIMSIVPAHLLRSIGGGYDNESIAMTAMVWTFWSWTRALRDTKHTTDESAVQVRTLLWGALSGVAYFYMVAAWGGYVFVLNVIGVHASALVLMGRYSTKLHRAYTAFYAVGTVLAIQVPVVGLTPLKSLEQMGPLLAFGGMQLLEVCAYLQRKNPKMTKKEIWALRVKVFAGAAVAAGIFVMVVLPKGYFGPLSSRVRGLFVKHTKTGNPLVDSVAEHQAASPEAYFQYLHYVCYLAPLGWLYVALVGCTDSSSFLLVYGVTAYFFSHKMVRLILLTAPIASATAGIALGKFTGWALGGIVDATNVDLWEFMTEEDVPEPAKKETSSKSKKKSSKSNGAKNGGNSKKEDSLPTSQPMYMRIVRIVTFAFVVNVCMPIAGDFWELSHQVALQVSHPTIIQKAQRRDTGEEVVIDDYRQAYLWLKKNTPSDARIMAWWDYGYQITAISNRTTIADGNTWNHEHIALLGRTLTAPEKEGHRIARHLADYVLVWAGGGGDDLAKSPHLRRIANSVYRGLCSEATCRDFGFYQNRQPTPDLAKSMLYKLHSHKLDPNVKVDPNRFKEVHQTKYGKVRIFKILSVSKESKEWVNNPENRNCDAPGSWMCRGQYPPALEKVLKEKKDFKQLEDFNAQREDDSEYQREYMENLKRDGRRQQAPDAFPMADQMAVSKERIDEINDSWKDTEATGLMWQLISENRVQELMEVVISKPEIVHVRSADGRGPMWWAREFGHDDIANMLRGLGVSDMLKDAKGVTPLELS